jgi:hypothetical protein
LASETSPLTVAPLATEPAGVIPARSGIADDPPECAQATMTTATAPSATGVIGLDSHRIRFMRPSLGVEERCQGTVSSINCIL